VDDDRITWPHGFFHEWLLFTLRCRDVRPHIPLRPSDADRRTAIRAAAEARQG
jgi:hypothetical protein